MLLCPVPPPATAATCSGGAFAEVSSVYASTGREGLLSPVLAKEVAQIHVDPCCGIGTRNGVRIWQQLLLPNPPSSGTQPTQFWPPYASPNDLPAQLGEGRVANMGKKGLAFPPVSTAAC